jgi:site-specific DNA-methyltransferase (adenine-specific)
MIEGKKYQIVYADPPWSYNDKMSGHSFSLDHEYETQDKIWIQNLPIKEISDNECVLFLWAVSPLLNEAFEVIKAWGFKYKTVAFCWVKTYKDGSPVSNLGRWTMGGMELCLLATKGHPKRVVNNVKQILFNGRGKHSVKPHEVRKRIVQLMGDIPRIELFAREKYQGWDVWGNEVDTSVEIPNAPLEIIVKNSVQKSLFEL